MNAGEIVRFIVSAARKDANVVPEQLLSEGDEYEAAYYTKLIARAVATMLLPFGYTEKSVMTRFRYS